MKISKIKKNIKDKEEDWYFSISIYGKYDATGHPDVSAHAHRLVHETARSVFG